MERIVRSRAPVGREASATQSLGSVNVPLGGWDSPANKVIQTMCHQGPRKSQNIFNYIIKLNGLEMSKISRRGDMKFVAE